MNVVVCATPFQVLMAEKIIDLYPDEPFFGVMLVSVDNEKYAFYAQRLLAKCGGRGLIYVQKKQTHPIWALWDVSALKMHGLRLGACRRLYVASVDSILLQTFISGFDFEELYTFDDGTANIVAYSHYYQHDRHQSTLHRVLKTLLRNPYDLQKLKSRSQGHFTAFNLPNVLGAAQYLPLYDVPHQAHSVCLETAQTVRIFLGQPIYELARGLSSAQIRQKNMALAQKIIRDYSVDYYFPHPRENYRIEGIAYLDTPLVAEDFFVQYFRADSRYVLYTLCSGAALPFVGMPQVQIISIKPADYPAAADTAYDLMRQAGIDVIDLPAAD